MEFKLDHPLLGQITGLAKKDIAQFLGVQYASLADRFAPPKLVDDYGGHIDATRLGPTTITPPVGCDIEFELIQCVLDKPEDPGMSDVDGLNLNITIPTTVTRPAGGFPVVVFIHGGGLMLGANWWPQADMAGLVELSSKMGTPIIGVGINYRLGVCGFLDSTQLRAKGYPPNRGLLDQQMAFRWLRKNISGFGGNPDEITAMGHSAGSLSIMLHFDSSEDLFQRAICLSGTPLALPVFPPDVAQSCYLLVVDVLGLSGKTGDEQVEGLLRADPIDLLTKVSPSAPIGPVVDDGDVVIRSWPTFAELAKLEAVPRMPRSWCKSMMMGSSSLDASVFALLGLFTERTSIAGSFIDTILWFYPDAQRADVGKLMQCYGIQRNTSDKDACVAILRVFTDLKFFQPAFSYASAWPGDAHLYHMAEPNPWDGPYNSGATHVQDMAFMLQNYNEKMTEDQRAVGKAFALDVLAFAYGKKPFPTIREARQIRVYGRCADGSGAGIVGQDEAGPSKEIRSLWDKIDRDVLSNACTAYHFRA